MAKLSGLRAFVEKLEAHRELICVHTPVNPHLEITEIIDRLSKANGPAVLFENTGTGFPLLINAYGSERRMAMALGLSEQGTAPTSAPYCLDAVGQRMEALFHKLLSPKASLLEKLQMLPTLASVAGYLPRRYRGKPPCQEVVYLGKEASLSKLPILQCWPADGGKYITLPIIHTYHPQAKQRNVGMYRVQVLDDYRTAIHWQLHKVSRRHYDAWKTTGQRMPVAIVLGGDPIYAYAATAPLPEGVDEYILAGFLRENAVRLTKCLTQPIEVPADADIVIEGYVDPAEPLVLEGPFGDHTGYYSLPDYYPAFHVTAITHRKDAIYPATIVGIPPQEDAWIGKATERIFLTPIRLTMMPEIYDMDLPIEGVFHNMAIVSIEKEYPGQGLKVAHALWGAGQLMLTKIVVVLDKATSVRDYWAVARAACENADLRTDLIYSQGPLDVLDHACSQMAFGGKLAIDATQKAPEEHLYPPLPYPKPDKEALALASLRVIFSELLAVNLRLIEQGIPIWIGSFHKTEKRHGRRLAEKLAYHPAFRGIKVILLLEGEMPIEDLGDVFWRFVSNVDMRRDTTIVEDEAGFLHLIIDASTKSAILDDFQRPWPNVTVMDEATIQLVDEKWPLYGLGPFISSPSRKYRLLMQGVGAVALTA
jgi:4-hydroxy-3-polyprenylbenzoate decarboxylase